MLFSLDVFRRDAAATAHWISRSSGTPNSDITVETDYDWKGRKTLTAYPVSSSVQTFSGYGKHHDDLRCAGSCLGGRSDFGTTARSRNQKTTYLPGAQHQVTDPNGQRHHDQLPGVLLDDPSAGKVGLVRDTVGLNQSMQRDLYGNPTAIRPWGDFTGQSADLHAEYLIYDPQHAPVSKHRTRER